MIVFDLSIKRSFWGDDQEKLVKVHHMELLEMKETLRKFGYEYTQSLFGSDNALKSMQRIVDEEISYCEFYKYYQAKRMEPGFEQWRFSTKDEVMKAIGLTDDHWAAAITGDRWIRSNGKIKANVEIIQPGKDEKMVKLHYCYENDNPHVKFLRDHESEWSRPFHLKNELAIEDKIRELKTTAEHFMAKAQMPPYQQEIRNISNLRMLLCAE